MSDVSEFPAPLKQANLFEEVDIGADQRAGAVPCVPVKELRKKQ